MPYPVFLFDLLRSPLVETPNGENRQLWRNWPGKGKLLSYSNQIPKHMFYRYMKVKKMQWKSLGRLHQLWHSNYVECKTSEIGVQTDAMPVPAVVESSSVDTACDAQQSSCRCDEPASPLNAADHRSDDDDFIPSDSESNTTVSSVSSVLTDDSTPSVHDDQKYIIFWSCLLSLIRLIHCPRCVKLT
ncbi:uncharacterized protein [Ptychodera flava]|uniref:uncharacterized protein n=1 Tax=Ptychodera flava TaxID=63121 RepID=UPI003969CBD1